jgi:hypothetical protein
VIDAEQIGRCVYGNIRIGDFWEDFVASLGEWSPEDYRLQWRQAGLRLLNGESKSAFVTSFSNPNRADLFEWWPCYRCDDVVIVRSQFRFYDQLPSPFSLDLLYTYIEDRTNDPASEWQMPIQWVRGFVDRIG